MGPLWFALVVARRTAPAAVLACGAKWCALGWVAVAGDAFLGYLVLGSEGALLDLTNFARTAGSRAPFAYLWGTDSQSFVYLVALRILLWIMIFPSRFLERSDPRRCSLRTDAGICLY